MKPAKQESGFMGGAVVALAIFGVLLAVGLFVPALQPLALQVGNALSLGILAVGLGVAVYVAWRIITFPSRRRKTAAARQRAVG